MEWWASATMTPTSRGTAKVSVVGPFEAATHDEPRALHIDMDVDPGLVCQQCHGLIDRPVAVNLCPLCKGDLHTDCLDVHFWSVHKESFERWNRNKALENEG